MFDPEKQYSNGDPQIRCTWCREMLPVATPVTMQLSENIRCTTLYMQTVKHCPRIPLAGTNHHLASLSSSLALRTPAASPNLALSVSISLCAASAASAAVVSVAEAVCIAFLSSSLVLSRLFCSCCTSASAAACQYHYGSSCQLKR